MQFDHVWYRYPEHTEPALSDITFAVPRGCSVALIGQSGSGKSTLLSQCNALSLPETGSVVIAAYNTQDAAIPLHRIRCTAGLSIQNPESALFEHYVADDVAFGPRNKGLRGAALRGAVAAAMDTVGLAFEVFADRETLALSGGEKRKAALAGVIAMDSPVVLLDEPTAALDGASQNHVLQLIHALQNAGKTVIVSTHSMEMAAHFDMIAVIAGGRLAAFDVPQRIFGRQWSTAWGLRLPWTVAVAQELVSAGCSLSEPVPLTAQELFDSLCTPQYRSQPLPAPQAPRRLSLPKQRRHKTELIHALAPAPAQSRSSVRLGAGTKLALLLLGGILALSMPHPAAPLGIAVAAILAGIVSGAIPPKKMLRRFMMAVPLLGILVVFQTIFSWQDDSSAVLFSIGIFSLTNNELLRSMSLLCRLVALISLIVLYTAVSTTSESLAALQKGLSPLSRLGVPVSDIALAVGITMRFVPVLAHEAEHIITAQLSRGAKGRLRSAVSMIIPLFLRSLERSLKVAQAMELRLYRQQALPGAVPSLRKKKTTRRG